MSEIEASNEWNFFSNAGTKAGTHIDWYLTFFFFIKSKTNHFEVTIYTPFVICNHNYLEL